MRETVYESRLKLKLRSMFPGCVILKNDARYIQGLPDLTILFGDRWAMLEVKTSAQAPYEPNQEHYIDMMNEMSFAAVIYPQNEDEVLYDLQHALCDHRSTRLS